MGIEEIILIISIGMYADKGPAIKTFEYPQISMRVCEEEKKKFVDSRGTSKWDSRYIYTAFCTKRYTRKIN